MFYKIYVCITRLIILALSVISPIKSVNGAQFLNVTLLL